MIYGVCLITAFACESERGFIVYVIMYSLLNNINCLINTQ